MSLQETLYTVTRTIPSEPEKGWGEMTNTVADVVRHAEQNSFKDQGVIIPYSNFEVYAPLDNDTIGAAHHEIRLNPAANRSLSAATAIASGNKDGQRLRLVNVNASFTVLLLHGANTRLNGNYLMRQWYWIELEWNFPQADWIEIARSH